MEKEMLLAVDDRRYYDPVICLLMWAVALNGMPARRALQALGVEEREVQSMFGGLEPELVKMRQLKMVSELFGREFLAKLIRGRLAELLMKARRPGDIATLVKAAAQLPSWVLDCEPGVDTELALMKRLEAARAERECADVDFSQPDVLAPEQEAVPMPVAATDSASQMDELAELAALSAELGAALAGQPAGNGKTKGKPRRR
jgi:hypothetical protein